MLRPGWVSTSKPGTPRHARTGSSLGRPEVEGSGELPPLSICRLETRDEFFRKLQQHADDPAFVDFACPICWEPFWQPVRTVCGHAFCKGCLLKSTLAQLEQVPANVSCPMCRHPLTVNDITDDIALVTGIRLLMAECSQGSGSVRRAREQDRHRAARGACRHGFPDRARAPQAPLRSQMASDAPERERLVVLASSAPLRRPAWQEAEASDGGHTFKSWVRVAPSASQSREAQPLRGRSSGAQSSCSVVKTPASKPDAVDGRWSMTVDGNGGRTTTTTTAGELARRPGTCPGSFPARLAPAGGGIRGPSAAQDHSGAKCKRRGRAAGTEFSRRRPEPEPTPLEMVEVL